MKLNLDAEFWDKISKVVESIGSRPSAVGWALLWLNYENNRKGQIITDDDWSLEGFPTALIGTFAMRTEHGFKAYNASARAEIAEKRKNAGRKGGTSKAKASKTKQNVANAKTQEVKTNEFISFYIKQFKLRYGAAPPIQGKDTGIAKRLLKEFGLERLTLLLDAYFAMPDAYVLKAKHPLNLFAIKMNEVVVFAETGKFTTQRDARMQDSISTVHSQIERIKRGEL